MNRFAPWVWLALAPVLFGAASARDAAASTADTTADAEERVENGARGAQPSLKTGGPSQGAGLEDAPSPADVARREAIRRGLEWLARAQEGTHDGSFPIPRGDSAQPSPVGVAALGALAFMAGGSSPGRGPHGRETQAVVDYLLGKADLAQGSPRFGYIAAQSDRVSRMHGHGFATLALAEAYGMGPRDPRLEAAVVAAVGCIERSQSPEGGWHYEPRPVNHEGSVTVCLVQALRAARNSGIRVDPEVVHRAEDYVLKLKNDAGLYRYQLDSDQASIALTAAGISTLNAAGRYADGLIKDGVDTIWRGLADRAPQSTSQLVLQGEWPYYERLYLAQAFYQLADLSHFERWFTAESERLLREQEADGRWKDRRYGDAYATAATVLVLALPDGLLPIYQR